MTTYSEYREKIKSGDIVLLSHSGWKTLHDWQVQAVRLFTRSEYSHVGLVWKVGKRTFLLESVTPFVRIVPLSLYAEEGFYVIHMKTPPSSKEIEFALKEVGVGKYSKWDAIKGFLRTLKIGANRTWQCTEYLIACRKLSGVNIFKTATPSEVAEDAMKEGMELKLIKGN